MSKINNKITRITRTYLTTFSIVFIVDFEQENIYLVLTYKKTQQVN